MAGTPFAYSRKRPAEDLITRRSQVRIGPIKRVVRPDSSQQTDQLKTLLAGVNPSAEWSTTYARASWPIPPTWSRRLPAARGHRPSPCAQLRDRLVTPIFLCSCRSVPQAPGLAADRSQPLLLRRLERGHPEPAHWTFTFNKRLVWIALESSASVGSHAEPTRNTDAIRTRVFGTNCIGSYFPWADDWAFNTGQPEGPYSLCTPAE